MRQKLRLYILRESCRKRSKFYFRMLLGLIDDFPISEELTVQVVLIQYNEDQLYLRFKRDLHVTP